MRLPRRSRGGVPGRPRSQISTSERRRSRRPILGKIATSSSPSDMSAPGRARCFGGLGGTPDPLAHFKKPTEGRPPKGPGVRGAPSGGGRGGPPPAGEDDGREVQSNRRSGELGRRRVLGTGLARLDV